MHEQHGRTAGILMPVASLPGPGGAGTLGQQAYRFVDYLADMGIGIWQLLPLNPMGYGNSPYQPFSSHAGDELYVDLDVLEAEGWLEAGRTPYYPGPDPARIDYSRARAYQTSHLHRAYRRFRAKAWESPDFRAFCRMDWVYPYAVFMALKGQNGQRCWNEWPREQQDWILDGQYDISHLDDEIGYHLFVQFQFYRQWMALKDYANSRGVRIMGDVPFYVGIDSLDVWRSREDFLLDSQRRPAFVAGVPPDFFSKTGQRWGNPIYNWDNLERKGFTFWVNRLKYNSKLYDIIRIDHFRAFDTFWKIPASCETAVEGRWVEAPGYALFRELYRAIPDIRIVAEDLGDLRPQVLELRDHFGLMGMNVVLFSIPDSEWFQPHQLTYTGTHDNDTVMGWYRALDSRRQKKVREKLAKYGKPRERIHRKMLRYVFGSPSAMAIVPLADILGLGNEARLNTPGTVGSPNWEWRLTDWRSLRDRKAFVRELVAETGRAPAK